MTEAEAALYEQPFEHVLEHVKPERMRNNREVYRRYWWRHGEPRIGMRAALAGLSRFIVTPETPTHTVFAWLSGSILPDKMLIAIARDDDATVGILSSRFHRKTNSGLRPRPLGRREGWNPSLKAGVSTVATRGEQTHSLFVLSYRHECL
ncbi:MAG: hypothetical protein FWH15_08025 [Betaproteobacteria bacterium]|nr:hypothetical protein [Betaproteobacteria bacterium]